MAGLTQDGDWTDLAPGGSAQQATDTPKKKINNPPEEKS